MLRPLLLLLLAACAGTEPETPPPAAAPRVAPSAPAPGDDVVPVPETPEGTAPLAVQVPSGAFTDAEVQCADGSIHTATLQEAGAKTVVMAPGLPLGASCVIFWKGSFMSRLAPVTGGQRWACKFRRAEPVCKRLGGPEGPTLDTPADWPWDKVDNTRVTKAEARAFDEAAEATGPTEAAEDSP